MQVKKAEEFLNKNADALSSLILSKISSQSIRILNSAK